MAGHGAGAVVLGAQDGNTFESEQGNRLFSALLIAVDFASVALLYFKHNLYLSLWHKIVML